MQLNQNYNDLKDGYLFSTIAKKISQSKKEDIIRLGIGDVTLPLCDAVVKEMAAASSEMGHKETFKGYGPDSGYDFLKLAIKQYYNSRDIKVSLDEIFVSDGAKSDVGNIQELFAQDNIVLIPDPVYPVYVDTNVMAGRNIVYLDATEENDFLPLPKEDIKADIIYLCSPNNPTGAVYNKEQLKKWVDYAISNKAVILFDAAYEAFIQDPELPRSIFEIEGAKRCAIEFCSFSKMAGFTGTRCGYTIVPMELEAEGTYLNAMWQRRQATKFNNVAYVVQRGAAAVFTPEGQAQTKQSLKYYFENAKIISDTLSEIGIWYTGGKNSPYIWFKCQNGMGSWEYFDYLLANAGVVGTPGVGFGKNGEGFFRLTAFGDREKTIAATQRMKRL